MITMAFDHDSLETELRQVLNRHAELLGTKEGAARAAAIILKIADEAARPKTLDLEAEYHPDGVVMVGYPEGSALAFLGSYQKGDWLDSEVMEVDVAQYDHIEIRADGDR